MIEMIDAQVGEIIDSLKRYGIDQNTLVFISGDNGGQYYFPKDLVTKQKNWPRGFFAPNDDPNSDSYFRGEKGNYYEGGLRIPMIAWWPGKIMPTQVNDFLWYFADMMPTMAEVAGVTPPVNIDGLSILPTLIGEAAAGHAQEQHEYLFWGDKSGNTEAVRMRNWKLMIKSSGKVIELYNLDNDISETTNLAKTFPDTVTKMKAFAVDARKPY